MSRSMLLPLAYTAQERPEPTTLRSIGRIWPFRPRPIEKAVQNYQITIYNSFEGPAGEGYTYLIIKEMNGMLVQSERQCFEERNVVSHDFFIRKIKLVHNYGIDMIVREQIICKEKKTNF